MVYVQIKDGIILNRIILNDAALESAFIVGYDYLKRVDELSPEPQLGWLYDSGTDTYSEPV